MKRNLHIDFFSSPNNKFIGFSESIYFLLCRSQAAKGGYQPWTGGRTWGWEEGDQKVIFQLYVRTHCSIRTRFLLGKIIRVWWAIIKQRLTTIWNHSGGLLIEESHNPWKPAQPETKIYCIWWKQKEWSVKNYRYVLWYWEK